jgi:hypothetical protein
MNAIERIRNNRDADLVRMLEWARAHGRKDVNTGLKPVFDFARSRPDAFRNAPPVLAICLGGTQSRVMLADVRDGIVHVKAFRSRVNPERVMEFDDYFDDIFFSEPAFAEYLRGDASPLIGLGIGVGIVDGVPLHPTKIPNVRNLVARELPRDADTHNLRRNMLAYLKRRGISRPRFFFEGDCPLAHLASVVMAGLGPDEPSLLSVCGTGMATADDEYFIFFAHAPVLLDDDPDLFPPEETEDGQLQFCVAGKGLWGVMRRAIELRAREDGSPLAGVDAARWFPDANASELVSRVWVSTLSRGETSEDVEQMKAAMSTEAFAELQTIAAKVMEKAVSAFVSQTLASLITMPQQVADRPYTIFVEGGVAIEQHFFARFKREMESCCADRRLFERLDAPLPCMPRVLHSVHKARVKASAEAADLRKLDVSLVGSIILAIAGLRIKETERKVSE